MEEKLETKKKSAFAYFKPHNLQKEISRYGYHFSLKRFWQILLLELVLIGVISYQLGLSLPYILVIMAGAILCTPLIILSVYRSLYEQKRFADITGYMEQILYSFKRRGKILDSLEDTLELFHEGEMHDAISQAIAHIRDSEEGDYETAFLYIEKEYGCDRIKAVHDFLIKVETAGGKFEGSVDILLEDRDMWVERSYELQAEKKNLKNKIGISVLLSLLICGCTVMMLPDNLHVTDGVVSRVATTAVILVDILIFVFAQVKLTGSWTEEGDSNQKDVERYYHIVKHFDKKKEGHKANLLSAGILAIALFAGFVLKQYIFMGIGIGIAIWQHGAPQRKYKRAKKHIIREIKKKFPKWLMELALLLHTDNVVVAIGKTVEKAPFVLKEDLQELLTHIDEQPGSVVPYLTFLQEFDLPDVQSAMKILFSMTEYGAENSEKQIGTLIKRNAAMMDRAERMRNEDRMAGMSMLFLLPMLTGTMKMLVDLAMMLIALTNLAGVM